MQKPHHRARRGNDPPYRPRSPAGLGYDERTHLTCAEPLQIKLAVSPQLFGQEWTNHPHVQLNRRGCQPPLGAQVVAIAAQQPLRRTRSRHRPWRCHYSQLSQVIQQRPPPEEASRPGAIADPGRGHARSPASARSPPWPSRNNPPVPGRAGPLGWPGLVAVRGYEYEQDR
jgi:hypothetical protein